MALVGQGHDKLTEWAAVLGEEELEQLKRRFVAKRLLSHLLTNPQNEPLMQRLAPLLAVQSDNKEFVAVFAQHEADLARLVDSASTLERLADFVDQANGGHTQVGAVHMGLTPALLLAARVVSLWDADLNDASAPQGSTAEFHEMPLGIA